MSEALMQFPPVLTQCDEALAELDAAKQRWMRTSVAERIGLLKAIKDSLLRVAEGWAEAAVRGKQIPASSPLAGEEWISGPYALMSTCNGLLFTLSHLDGKAFVKDLPTRTLFNGQLAVQVTPHSLWDRLLLSGVRAAIWMKPGVTKQDLIQQAATAYHATEQRPGKVALVLAAGNIAAIAPLDCFQKLFIENQVVLLKMNPVNDYLTDYLSATLKPLIDHGALRIVRGDGAVGAYLANHPLVEEIHITGSVATHDAIVWGTSAEGTANKAAGRRHNQRPISSELGAVCPTIVVPGPWSAADLRFQAEHIATQKLHNSGFNCIACQVLVLPQDWTKEDRLLDELARVVGSAGRRPAYYPGAKDRVAAFEAHSHVLARWDRGQGTLPLTVSDLDRDDGQWTCRNEVFAPALSLKHLPAPSAEAYLNSAIAWVNETLYGTLGANILIHPRTVDAIGRTRFEATIAKLQYGCIAINAWTGLGFLLTGTPWGDLPGRHFRMCNRGSATSTTHSCWNRPNARLSRRRGHLSLATCYPDRCRCCHARPGSSPTGGRRRSGVG
jgi:acyl-CoA reductase-like NAD-dependent aldehyde dehydrogenase